MSAGTSFDGNVFENELDSVKVDARGLDSSKIESAKRGIRNSINGLTNFASRYINKAGYAVDSIRNYFKNRTYKFRNVEERGVGGYYNPETEELVIASNMMYENPRFAEEAYTHEMGHNLRDKVGSMYSLGRGLKEKFGEMGEYVHRVFEELAATRITQKLIGYIQGYPQLQPILADVEKKIGGEEKLIYNTEKDAEPVFNALAPYLFGPSMSYAHG